MQQTDSYLALLHKKNALGFLLHLITMIFLLVFQDKKLAAVLSVSRDHQTGSW